MVSDPSSQNASHGEATSGEGLWENSVSDGHPGGVQEISRQVPEDPQQGHLLEGVGGQDVPDHAMGADLLEVGNKR